MTSRIQEDGGGGKEAKWADIDDEEEDWAPEAIEWTDGMKITLTHNEPPLPPPQTAQPQTAQPPPAQPPPVQERESPKKPKDEPPPVEQAPAPEPIKAVPKPTTNIGPNPTVLRLGANAERQAKNASVASKGTNEKQSPASTSPAPVPAKSPWASLPPVEKLSPIIPPVQVQRSPRASFKEAHATDKTSGPAPPKEIAADDFNRSWKEDHSGAPRELFNSRSGRLEPVSETRKGSWRNEQNLRTPSLLQRPTNFEAGPAEPSPAFQTQKSNIQDGAPWSHRRTSSNISGGSGGFGRQLSSGRPEVLQGHLDNRRGSHMNGTVDHSIPPHDLSHSKEPHLREVSPSHKAPSPSWRARSSSNANRTTSATPAGPPPPAEAATSDEPAAAAQEVVDPVALQERIMKEKRMEARQRRIEQENKEEAAKRERIRQKLEALGPAPDKSKPVGKEASETGIPEPALPAPTTTASQPPPKPPVPEPTGEPKQYGLMKVHHPDSVRKLVAANEGDKLNEKPAPAANARHASPPSREAKPDAATTNGSRRSSEPQVQTHGKPTEPNVEESTAQWGSKLGVSNYSPWTPNATLAVPSPVTNPWKPLNYDRTLGNGIFEQALGGFSPRDLHLRNHLGLEQSPIVPPPATHDRLAGPQPFPVSSRPAQEIQSLSSLPSPELKNVNPIPRPTPIGPPSSQQAHWQQQEARRAQSTNAWNNFHDVAVKRETEENERLIREMDAIRDAPPSALQVNFNETWRQVRTGEQFGQRHLIGITKTADNELPPVPNLLPSFDHQNDGLPLPETHSRPFTARGSRFFPSASEQPKKAAPEDHGRPRSPSPPPPEESNHPAFAAISHRPLVNLPAPKPIVKLPPKIVAPPPPPPTFASMAAAPPPPRVPVQPVSAASVWQEKINGLFGKKGLNEKRNALAVASVSKEPLDVQSHTAAVSVSLPQNLANKVQVGDGEVTSQQVQEEEDLFEDREVGSLPVVRVPNMAPPAAWVAALPPSQSRLRSKILKPMQVQTIEPYFLGFFDKDQSGNILVSIRLPGSDIARTAVLPKKSGSNGPRQRGNFRPRKNTRGRSEFGNHGFKKSPPSQQVNGDASSPRYQPRNAASWTP